MKLTVMIRSPRTGHDKHTRCRLIQVPSRTNRLYGRHRGDVLPGEGVRYIVTFSSFCGGKMTIITNRRKSIICQFIHLELSHRQVAPGSVCGRLLMNMKATLIQTRSRQYVGTFMLTIASSRFRIHKRQSV